MSHSDVWHDSCTYVDFLIDVCSVTMCYLLFAHVWHDSFICVTWLIHMCDMTRSYMWHDLIVCDMTSTHTNIGSSVSFPGRSDLSIYVTWPIHMTLQTYECSVGVVSWKTWRSFVTQRYTGFAVLLQCCCSVVAVCCSALPRKNWRWCVVQRYTFYVLQCCCSVLWCCCSVCVAVRCSASPRKTWRPFVGQRRTFCVLQCVLRCAFRFFAVCYLGRPDFRLSNFVCSSVVAVCCSVLQCACCGELLYAILKGPEIIFCDAKVHLLLVTELLQCVAVCVLPCVAVHHRTRHDVGLSRKGTPVHVWHVTHIQCCSSRTTKVHLVGVAVLLQYVAVCVLKVRCSATRRMWHDKCAWHNPTHFMSFAWFLHMCVTWPIRVCDIIYPLCDLTYLHVTNVNKLT